MSDDDRGQTCAATTHAWPAPDADDDDAFDNQLPRRMQMKSAIHFTPIAVARCAARLLAPRPGMRVLDVGAGPGKFCLVAASETPDSTYVGVEVRPHLVRFAKQLAGRLAVPNVEFVAGDALDLDWSGFDAFYLYNPFGEHVQASLMLDRTLALDPARFRPYAMAVHERLDAAPVGTRVVTYHGFGVSPPEEYDLAERFLIGSGTLELWIKTRELSAHAKELLR